MSLPLIYSNTVSILQKQRDDLNDGDIEQSSPKCAFFIISLHSSVEFFLSRCFERLIEQKYNHLNAAKEYISGHLSGNKIDFDLYMSVFVPECYKKSERWRKITQIRNFYAHSRIFDNKSGSFTNAHPVSIETIDQYFEYSKEVMRSVMEAVTKKIEGVVD
jgi:hypothetical protein